MKLIIFVEIENVSYLLAIFVILVPKKRVKVATISKTSPKDFQVRDLKVKIIVDKIENVSNS